jgi:lipoyl(octanoyl) transferase
VTSSRSSPRGESPGLSLSIAVVPTSTLDSPDGAAQRPLGEWSWLGRVSFERAARLQERLRREVLAERRGEALLLLEHDPVITLGRSADPGHILLSEADLAREGIIIHKATRGGDVTYHGPGQLVGYPVVRLRAGVRAHVRAMAAAIVDVLAEWGIEGYYRDDAPGVWVRRSGENAHGCKSPEDLENRDAPGDGKIAAFGINVHRRVAIHGFALNINPRLDHFSRIVPCGLAGCSVVSVEQILGRAPPPLPECADRMARALDARLGITFRRCDNASELLCQSTPLE